MDKDPANINNYYYGMVLQNCDMSSATIQTINQAVPPRQSHTPHEEQGGFLNLVTHPDKAETVVGKLHELVVRHTKAKEIVKPIRAAMVAGALYRPTW